MQTLFYVLIFLTVILCVHFFKTKLYHHFLCWHLLCFFFFFFSSVSNSLSIGVCEPCLLTGCWPKILLVLKQTSEAPWTSRQMQRCCSLIYPGPLVASTNKVIIPLNLMFSVDAFFFVLLRRITLCGTPKGRKLLPQTLETQKGC